MRQLSFVVPPEYDGRKAVHFLRGEAGCSSALITSLKHHPDGIMRNGEHVRTIDRLNAGDTIELTLRDEVTRPLELSDIAVDIVYEDDDVIVYNKPYGMACHPVRGVQLDTLANVFARDCAERGQPSACRIMGRLDRDTSGAVVVAKNAFAGAALAGTVDKTYIALVGGTPPGEGTVDAPIGRVMPWFDASHTVIETGKHAVTHYKTVELFDGYSAVKCTLETGRTHQIRVHMAHIGCPLLGDALYGGDCALIGRQALHCVSASFTQPVGKNIVAVDVPFFGDMQKLMPRGVKSW